MASSLMPTKSSYLQLTTGVSTAPPLVFPCTPNSTVCPAVKFPFQLKLVAEYGLEPVTVAFQELVKRFAPAYCQVAVQWLIALMPLLVTRIAP